MTGMMDRSGMMLTMGGIAILILIMLVLTIAALWKYLRR